MKTVVLVAIFSLSISFAHTSSINRVHNDDTNKFIAHVSGDSNGQSKNPLYKFGVDSGIINSEKYSLEAFERDEKNVFKDMYRDYVTFYDHLISYEDWVIMNNFGLLPDTQESLLEWKSNDTRAGMKNKFVDAVRTGDILIVGLGGRGTIVGHAAIMTTDNWVVEMPGIRQSNAKSNNRRISKSDWYDIHKASWTTVYRSPNTAVAKEAASWATLKYFNPSGGSTKTVHIDYKIDNNFSSVNPSYCSKLVIQAFHYGTGSKKVINENKLNTFIAPYGIPDYFLSPYKLNIVGKY